MKDDLWDRLVTISDQLEGLEAELREMNNPAAAEAVLAAWRALLTARQAVVDQWSERRKRANAPPPPAGEGSGG